MSSSPALRWPWLVAALSVAVPLALDPRGRLPFLPPKEALLLAGVCLLPLAVAVDRLARGRRGADAGKAGAGRGDAESAGAGWADAGKAGDWGAVLHLPTVLLLILFWAWSVAAPLHRALSPGLHLDAALSLTALVALSLATALAGSADPRWRRRLALALAVSAAGVTVHAILQAAGRDPLDLLGAAPGAFQGRWRLFTTAGNPNWTAAYLALTAPFLAWALYRHPAARVLPKGSGLAWDLLRPLAGGATARSVQPHLLLQVLAWGLVLAAVLATGSRLGALALAAAGAGWISALRATARSSVPSSSGDPHLAPAVTRAAPEIPAAPAAPAFRALTGWLLVLTALAVAAALVLGARATGGLRDRWADLGSLAGRGFHLLAGLRLVEAAPLTGHGLSQSGLLLPEAVREIRPRLGPAWEPWIPTSLLDQLPNELVETAAGSGLVGLALLVTLWVVVVRRAAASWAGALRRDGAGTLRRDGPGAMPPSHAAAGVPLEAALGPSLLAFAVLTLGSAPLRGPMTALPFFVVLGLMAAGSRVATPGGGRGWGTLSRGWGTLGMGRAPRMARAPEAAGALRFAGTRSLAGAGRFAGALGFAAAAALPFLVLPRALAMVQGNRAVAQARGVLEQGDLQGAERAFRHALELTPRSHEAAVFLAGLLLERDEADEALQVLDRAVLGGASPEDWILRAEALRQLGELPKATAVLERAVATLPRLVRAHFLLGEIHDEMGDMEAARQAYRRVVDRAAGFPAATSWAELAQGRLALMEAWDGRDPTAAPAPHRRPDGES